MIGECRMRGKYVVVTIVVLLVTVMTWTSFNTDKDLSFPKSIGDMKLTSQIVGPEAIESTRRLHGNSAMVQMIDAAVLVYRAIDVESRIWVSRTESDNDASSLLDAMNDAIDPGDGFSTPVRENLPLAETVVVYYTFGYGSDHYYYLNEDSVYWIAFNGLTDDAQFEFVAEAINTLK